MSTPGSYVPRFGCCGKAHVTGHAANCPVLRRMLRKMDREDTEQAAWDEEAPDVRYENLGGGNQ